VEQNQHPVNTALEAGAIDLLIEQTELTLPRLVGLVERRGFAIRSMRLDPAPGGFNVRLHVCARAPHFQLGVLERQIDRLLGVRRLSSGGAVLTGEAA
jgi:acetolactate synthase regulatory subunit